MSRRVYSERHGCALVGIARSSFRYAPRPRVGETVLVERIRRLATEHPAYGYRRITAVLRREGSPVNKKRVHRIWKAEGLQALRRRPRKRRRGPPGDVIRRAGHPNHVWTYDFIEDRTERGGKLRMLTVLDEYTRESLAIRVERSIKAERVIETLEWLFLTKGAPQHMRSDNGPELVAKAVQDWLVKNGCRTIYIEPGSPWENPYIESFHGTFRRECLDRYAFVSGREAQEIVAAWRQEYNEHRPHSSLGYMTPAEFARRCRAGADQGRPRVAGGKTLTLTAGGT